MAKNRRELPELTPAQNEIMEIVWKSGEVSASEVGAISRGPARSPATRSARCSSGWRKRAGSSIVRMAERSCTRPPHPRQVTIGQKVLEVVETVCGGSAEAMVTALLDYRGLNLGELERIREMLARARATKKDKGKP